MIKQICCTAIYSIISNYALIEEYVRVATCESIVDEILWMYHITNGDILACCALITNCNAFSQGVFILSEAGFCILKCGNRLIQFPDASDYFGIYMVVPSVILGDLNRSTCVFVWYYECMITLQMEMY